MLSADHAPPVPRRGRLGLGVIRRFRRDQSGATAVEFALVSVPFLAFLFAIIEMALAFWASQLLDTAVSQGARQLYTGSFQQNPDNQKLMAAGNAAGVAARFKAEICKNVTGVFDCATNVFVDVQAVKTGSFNDIINNGSVDKTQFSYQDSGPNDIVLVRALVELPVYVTLLNSNAANLTNGKRLIIAAAAFRNEPFQ